MFLTASSKIVPLPIATGSARHPSAPGRVAPAADGPTFQAGSNAETLDLATEIARRLEQDVDYQILRKAFALDAETLHRGTRASVAAASQTALSGSLSVDITSPRLSASSQATEQFSLRLSWTQVAERRLEVSTSNGDTATTLTSAFTSQRGQRLEFSVGDAAPVQVGDPLVLDLGGHGIVTTGIPSGVLFDLDGDGQTERMSTVTGESWFLALDWNANGRIDDGRELFGDQNGAAHGFAELARHDGNADGVIDDGDAVFATLRLVQLGEGGDQVSQSLSEANVTRIELGYQNVRKALDLYDQVAQTGRFTRADGSQGEAADVLLGYRDLG